MSDKLKSPRIRKIGDNVRPKVVPEATLPKKSPETPSPKTGERSSEKITSDSE